MFKGLPLKKKMFAYFDSILLNSYRLCSLLDKRQRGTSDFFRSSSIKKRMPMEKSPKTNIWLAIMDLVLSNARSTTLFLIAHMKSNLRLI